MAPLAAIEQAVCRQITSAAMSGAIRNAGCSNTELTVCPTPSPDVSPSSGKPEFRHFFNALAKLNVLRRPCPSPIASNNKIIWSVSSVQSPCFQRFLCRSSTREAGLSFSALGYILEASDLSINSVERPTASPKAAPQIKPRIFSDSSAAFRSLWTSRNTGESVKSWGNGIKGLQWSGYHNDH